MARIEPIRVFALLPSTNCKICGESTCLAFATKLASRDVEITACTPLFDEAEYARKKNALVEMLTPPIRLVKFGPPGNERSIGGEEVLHRHELTFHNETALIVALDDAMEEGKFVSDIDRLQNLVFSRIGKELKIDGFCIRSVSKDPSTFRKRVELARSKTQLPLCLASLDPEVIKAGLEVEAKNRPLIYAATVDNWKEMADLASTNNVPLVLTSGTGNQDEILTLANTIGQSGIDIVIDPGTWINDGWLGAGLRSKIELRRAAISAELQSIGYPFLSVPAVTQLFHKTSKDTAKYFREAVLSSILMEKYADILIISPTPYLWSLMPILTFRQSLYSDPRIHPEVDSGLRSINDPDETSPVCVSTNFALTYYTIKSDFEGQKLGTWLLLVDTGGLGVEAAVAGGQLTTDKIVDLMKETGIESKVSHKKIILPGLAARLSGELEDAAGWEVLVGPKDSADIKKVYKRWHK